MLARPLRRSALLFAMLAVPLTAAAAEPPLPPPEGRFCDEHPARCEEMRQRHDAFCKRNPQTCKTAKEKREARRKFCKKNPDRCEELYAERERRRDEMRERCASNPVDCEDEHREMMREHRDERRDRRREAFCREHPEACEAREKDRALRTGPPR